MAVRSIAAGFCRLMLYAGLSLLQASCASAPPADRGPVDGRLSPCPASPNCVCSEVAGTESHVLPLAFSLSDRDAAWDAARSAVAGLGGTIETATDTYLWATFRSRLFRFVDDLELRLDAEQGVVHVRSASRLGYSDLGVNRERVESLRKEFGTRMGGQAGE